MSPQNVTAHKAGKGFAGADDPAGANGGGGLVTSQGKINSVALTIFISVARNGFGLLNSLQNQGFQQLIILLG